MSILNVNQIQPVGSGQTVTISATNIDTGSATVTAGTFSGGVTVTSGNLTGITSVSTSNLTVNGNAYPNAGPLSNRNLIINGAMQVAQRGTQVTGETSGGYLTCDRFRPTITTLGTWTVDQSTDAPNGFSNSLKLTCTTADASPAAGDQALIRYLPEGQDLQGLAFGTADAKSFVVSFWVKSNKTGTATLSIIQIDDSNVLVSPTYTINSADTWEHKIIVIPGNTNAGIDNDNSLGLYIDWHLNSGSTYSSGTNRTTWSTYANADRNPSNLGVGGATSDYFAITGVQLEVGSVATPFEHRSYGDELARCQRYYYKISGASNDRYFMGLAESSTVFYGVMHAPVTMRTDPTLETSGTASHFRVSYSTDTTCNALPVLANSTQNTALIGGAIVASGLTANQSAMLASNNASSYLALTAEL
jgi:hypothetical protein